MFLRINRINAVLAFSFGIFFSLFLAAANDADIEKVRTFVADVFYPDNLIKGRNINPTKLAFVENADAITVILSDPLILKEALAIGTQKESFGLLEIIDLFLEKTGLKELVSNIELQKPLAAIDDDSYENLNKLIQGFASVFSFDEVGLDELDKINVEGQGPMGDFIISVLKNYHNMQDPQDKRFIISTFLRETMPNSSDQEKLLSVVKASGPFFHKLLQMAGDWVPKEQKELKDVLNEVKKNLLPIDHWKLTQLIKEVEAKSNNRFSIKIVKEDLGVASVGHALLVDLIDSQKNTTQQIVLKFIKPGVIERAKRDAIIFRNIADEFGPGIQDFFNDTKKDVLEELDLNDELKNLIDGNRYYNTSDPNDRIKAVLPIAEFPKDSRWIAMSLAKGISYSKPINTIEQDKIDQQIQYMVRGKALEELSAKWMMTAFFPNVSNGFYHGDLHGGNIIIDIDTKKIRDFLVKIRPNLKFEDIDRNLILMIPKNLYTLSLIDFGNAGELNIDERLHVINFFIATLDVFKNPEGFLKAYKGMISGKLSNDQEKSLKQELKKIFQSASGMGQLLEKIFTLFLTKDYPKFPSVMANFGRSQAMLSNAFNVLNEQAAQMRLKRVYFSFDNAIVEPLKKELIAGTLLLTERVGVLKGNKLFVNAGNAVAIGKFLFDTAAENIKKSLGLAVIDEGGTCSSHINCKGFGPGAKAIACCQGKCVKKEKNYLGIGYCPHECVGAAGAGPGTCQEKYHWPRHLGEPCVLGSDCAGHKVFGAGVACCKGACAEKKPQGIGGAYICPIK